MTKRHEGRAPSRAGLSGALALATVLVALPARAGDVALSETLFREGRALMDAGDYAHGCPKLAASHREDPATGTLLALALCQEKAGQLASAWASYVDAAARSRQEGRKDRETAAEERVHALEPRLSKLTLTVDAATLALPGLVVTRDGEVVSSAAFGTAVPTDGGEHVIEAKAEGKEPLRQVVTLGTEGDEQAVAVGPFVAAKGGASPAPATKDEAAVQVAPPSGLSTLQIVGIGVGAAGVVGLGVATYFGVHAKNLESESNDQGCVGNSCPPDAAATRRDAKSAGNLATAFVVAGGVLAAGGLTLFLVGGSRHEGDSASLGVSPVVLPGTAALVANGRF